MNVRRTISAAAVVLAVPMLASCGFSEQTDQVYNAAAGVDDRSGTVDVLDAQVVSGQTGSGTVVASLVNEDQTHADKLVQITPADQGSQDLTFAGPSGTKIPAGGEVDLGNTGQWTVRGQSVKAGSFVKITFVFQRAQAITVDVPVTSASNPIYSNVPLPQSAASSPSTSPGGKAAKGHKASPSVAPSPSASPS